MGIVCEHWQLRDRRLVITKYQRITRISYDHTDHDLEVRLELLKSNDYSASEIALLKCDFKKKKTNANIPKLIQISSLLIDPFLLDLLVSSIFLSIIIPRRWLQIRMKLAWKRIINSSYLLLIKKKLNWFISRETDGPRQSYHVTINFQSSRCECLLDRQRPQMAPTITRYLFSKGLRSRVNRKDDGGRLPRFNLIR